MRPTWVGDPVLLNNDNQGANVTTGTGSKPGDCDTYGVTNQAFIKVPMNRLLGDLSITGSSANVTLNPYSGNVQFVLSNEFTAAVPRDATTTAYDSTQLSEAPMSQTTTPTTQPPQTTAQVGSQRAAAPPQDVTLPATGSHGPGLAIGFALVLAGLFLSVFSRRRPVRSEV